MADSTGLRRSFERVIEHGDDVPLYFYSYLFLRHPEIRSLFPPTMAAQRDRLVGALARIVADVDNVDSLLPFVRQLGRDHRKYGVTADHYRAVGEALLATLQHFLGREWTQQLASDWTGAYQTVAYAMTAAAAQDNPCPAWWDAEIIRHERRGPDLAVITVRPESDLPYLPGQSISVETAQRPRMWRFYSPANVPRPDHSLELHVRAIDGGWVSTALVLACGVGDWLQLGPAVGELRLMPDEPQDLLMIAGGTGLAPLRAIIEQVMADRATRRRVHLYVEARTEPQLYDLPTLGRLARTNPWLTVVPVAQRGPTSHAIPGNAADVALQHARWAGHAVYLCGGPRMVAWTRTRLIRSGVPPAHIHEETFGYRSGPAHPGGMPGRSDSAVLAGHWR